MNRLWILDFGFWIGVLSAALLSSGCSEETPTSQAPTIQNPKSKIQNQIRFTDVTAASGINFSITCGKTPSSEILEVNGGGLGLIDFDNDGDVDLFVANGATLDNPEEGPGCRLFENLGNLTFRDVTSEAQISVRRWATGVAIGDYNGDGFDDIYICCYGRNILLRNNGDRTFIDVTATAFASEISNLKSQIPEWSTSAAFGDLDGDGDLDLYVCNYLEFDVRNRPPPATYKGVDVMAGPHGLTPQPDVVYENLGDGTFREFAEAAGFQSARPSFGMNLMILDFDEDGRQDIYVANDSMPDFLFHNQGSRHQAAGRSQSETNDGALLPAANFLLPRFQEIGISSGIAANADGGNQASMGIAIADVDGNGFADKFSTVFSSDVNALHLNVKNNFFEDRAQQYGLAMISRPYLGWSAGFFDFDHDSDEDLLFVNGHVYPQATMEAMDSEYQQPPLLFERSGPRFKRFTPAPGSWLAEKHRDRNAMFADFDDDGDIDIIIGELNGPIRVLRNDCSPEGNWLIVELKDNRPGAMNRRGFGSRIDLSIQDPNSKNESKQTRWLFTGGGFQSSSAPYGHFGLGEVAAGASIQLTVRWPDGTVQRVEDVRADERLVIQRNEPRAR